MRSSEPPPAASPPGTLLDGRYALISQLAAGAMGAVYSARDQATQTDVAVKILHPGLTGEPEIRRRFRRESTVLRALEHPAVVRVLEMGVDDAGRCYTVMELLRGVTLAERLAVSPRLPPAEVLRVLNGIAAGLDAVHAQGVLHGDLKPANVFLVAPAGAIKLLDFGLSKVHGLERLTRTGDLRGTPAYMAPELVTGDGTVDARIDVYALGAIAYELYAGRPAFQEAHAGRLLLDIALGRFVPLSAVRPDLASATSDAIAQAMHVSSDRRFVSASAFVRALAHVDIPPARGAT